ncbi:hypothetical protein Dimus_014870 [Dionaea muscipula]
MGTKVEFDNWLPGYYTMRDPTRDSNGGSWPSYNGDNGFPNGQYYYGFLPRGISNSHPGYDKDFLKQKMLEHEAIFKNQVYELHRLYRVQRDLMDEFKRKEGYQLQTPYETSSSSSPLPSQIPSEDAPKWNASSFPLGSSTPSKLHGPAPAIVQSSLNEITGKSIQVSPVSHRNCSSPKDSQTSESRPSKLRRKMFDLQLPADEYIDIDEVQQCVETNRPLDKNHKSASERGVKLFLNHHEKIECNGNGINSDFPPRKSNPLADLNEPFLVEEPTSFPSVEFSGNTMPRDGSYSVNFLGLPREILQNSQHGSINGISNNAQLESKGDGRCWSSYILEAEQSRDKLRSIHPSPQINKVLVPSQPVQFLLESTQHAPSFHPSNHSNGVPWRGKTGSERDYFHSESFHPAQGPTPSSFSHSTEWVNSWHHSVLSWGKSSGLVSQKSMSVQPIPCMTSAMLSKAASVHSNELFWNNKGLASSDLRANLDFGSEMPVTNGFYHGSSSGSRELLGRFPPGNIDFANRRDDDKRALASGDFFRTSSPHTDMNSKRDLNLNVVLSNGFPTYHNSQQLRIIDRAPKLEDCHPIPALPWLAGEGPCSKDAAARPRKTLNSLESALIQAPSELFSNNDSKKSLDRLNSLASTSCNGTRNEANGGCPSSRMILGVPVFEKPLVSTNEVTCSVGPQPSRDEEMAVSVRKAGFDINMPYDPMGCELDKRAADEVLQRKVEIGGAGLRDHIDLNSCASEDDVPPPANANVMMRDIDIDLEAPACPETEDDNLVVEEESSIMPPPHNPPLQVPQHTTEEEEEVAVAKLAMAAAEAIVDISTSVFQNHVADLGLPPMEDSAENPLHWFADVMISCATEVSVNQLTSGADASRNRHGEKVQEDDCLSSDSGYFESMTLKLSECDVEEHLSKPSEVLSAVESGINVSVSRTRKGQARRGRQRRDFQRDILPGLVSLSRHEVTEDVQTFGGLMRATGHNWHSGPRRNATRNGCARGRRRSATTAAITPRGANTVCALLKQQLSNNNNNNNTITTTTTTSQARLEDRSLTGWGRTTRRPRRQRFPAGNPAAVALT